MKRTRLWAVLLSICMLLSVAHSYTPWANATASQDLQISFIDCGQGDAIFMESEGESMLVDAGKASCAKQVTDFLDAKGITDIDYVVSSHPDEDHIGGMPDVYEQYAVDESIYSPFVADTQIYQTYMSAVKNEPDSTYHVARQSDSWYVGDAKVDVVFDGANQSNANDSSVVLKVSCGNTDLLLTGDMTQTTEELLIAANTDLDIDILKVAHHGSAGSSSQAFLTATTPQIAVISVGSGNAYGHPTDAALQRISAVCSNIYRTDQNGTVVLTVENDTIQYNDSTISSTQPSYCTAKTVYVTASGQKYHASSACSNMKNPIAKDLNAAKQAGYTACSKCVDANFESSVKPHESSNWITDTNATVLKAGSKHKECTACGEVLETATIPRSTFTSAPKTVTAALSCYNGVKLTWSKVSYASGYTVYYKPNTSKSWVTKKTKNTSYTISGLKAKTKYDFKVIPYLERENTTEVGTAKATSCYTTCDLSAPKSAKAKLYGYDDISLSWSKVSNAKKYKLYYKISGAKNYTYKTTTANTSYSFKNLADGKKYTFKIVPCTYVNGAYFEDGSYKTVSANTLQKIVKPTVKKSGSKKVTVTWKNISGESGYQISMATGKSKTKIVSTYSTTSGTSKKITAKKGKTYYYKVRAYRTVDGKKIYGPWSSAVAYKLK